MTIYKKEMAYHFKKMKALKEAKNAIVVITVEGLTPLDSQLKRKRGKSSKKIVPMQTTNSKSDRLGPKVKIIVGGDWNLRFSEF